MPRGGKFENWCFVVFRVKKWRVFGFLACFPGGPGAPRGKKILRGFKPAVLCAVFLRAWLLVAGPGLGLFWVLGFGWGFVLCLGLGGLVFWVWVFGWFLGWFSGAGFWLVFGRVWAVVFRALILGRSGPRRGPKHGRVWDLFFSNAVVFGRGISWCSGFQT